MKKSRLVALGAATVLAAAALTGCVRILPPGPVVTESADLGGDVHAVVLDTSGDLIISEGEPSLTIHAPQALLDLLVNRVDGGVLTLGRQPGPGFIGASNLRYELTVPSLDEIVVDGSGEVESSVSGDDLRIEIAGSGTVEVSGLAAGSVQVEISGSGDVELEGTADSLDILVDGSGTVDAADLEVVDAVVEISGSGDVEVNVTGTLRADVSGSGTVVHRGGARVDADVSGSGEVRER